MNLAVDMGKSVVEALTKHEVIQDVIKDTAFKPLGFLAIEYGAGSPVAMGNKLTVEGTQMKPTVQFIPDPSINPGAASPPVSDNDSFTLVMTDPDAPSRTDHKWSEYCHYVETDIKLLQQNFATKGDNLKEPQFISADVAGGHVLMNYVGPAPPKNTGDHRYVFLLYKQPKGVTASAMSQIKDNINWGYGTPATGVHKWATENKLELVAANFFFAENA